MTDGTNVGSIFLDLVVRDTVEQQVQGMAEKGQATARRAFSGMEKAASKSVNNTSLLTGKLIAKVMKLGDTVANGPARAAEKLAVKIASAFDAPADGISTAAKNAGKNVEKAIGGSFSKSVALAEEKVRSLEQKYAQISQRFAEVTWSYSYNEDGNKTTDKLAERLAAQREALYERLVSARNRLAIQTRVASEKQAAVEAAAARKTAAAEERTANRRKAIRAAMWKNMLSTAGNAIKKLNGKLLHTEKCFGSSGRAARRFGSRLREIVSGALIFNGISALLRKITSYFGDAISSTDQMKEALANLKGAAATAAAPIVEMLTPALVALTNAAATAFSYLARLISSLTGRSLSSMASAAKKMQALANAAKNIAGFDEIERLGEDKSIDPNYDFLGTNSLLDSLLEAIKAGQWAQIGTLIAQKINDSLAAISWPGILGKAQSWTGNLIDTIDGFIITLDWESLGESLGRGLNTALLVLDTFFHAADWAELGSGMAEGLNGIVFATDWEALGRFVTNGFKAMFELLHGFVQTFDFSGLGVSLASMFERAIKNIDWTQFALDISGGLTGLLESAIAFVNNLDWEELATTYYNCVTAIDWEGIFDGLLELLASLAAVLIIALGTGLAEYFADLGETLSSYFTEVGENGIQGFLNGMWNMLCDIGSWLYDHLVKPIIDGVCGALGIHSPSTVFAEIGKNLLAGLLGGIESTWSTIADFLVGAFEAVEKTLSAIWEDGIVVTLKNAINSIIGFINGLISGVVSGVNTVINALNRLKIDIPDWVPIFGGESFGFDIKPLSAPQIPMLKDGGIIAQPTLAMMGEYAGARSNPEIVAPQSVMAETVASVMEDVIASNIAGFEAVVAVLREILEAVLGIEIGDEVIGQAVARYNHKMAVVKGGS